MMMYSCLGILAMLNKAVIKNAHGDKGSKLSRFVIHHSSFVIALIALAIAACWLPSWMTDHPLRMRFPFDDTYITFRYAANVAHGFGIVWNPGGAHTEGYTNFLYMLMLVPFSAIGFDLVDVAQAINVVAVIVSAIALWRIANSVVQEGDRQQDSVERTTGLAPSFPGVLAVLLFYLDPFTWFNAWSGMETTLFTMWLLVTLWAFASRRVTWAFVFAMLATLTRPEGGIMGFIVLAVWLWMERAKPLRESSFVIRNFIFAFALPLAIYAVWKYWYFGDLLPNSFYVKVTQAARLFAGRGLLRLFYTHLWYLLLPALWAAWKGWNHSTVRVMALWCLLVSMFYLFAQVLMPVFDRYTNSVEAMLILLAAISVASVKRPMARYVLPAGMALLVLHVVYGLTIRSGLGEIQSDTEYEDRYERMASVFRSIPLYDSITLASADAGILPYYSGLRHLDLVGLNTNEIAHARNASEVVRFVARSHPDMIFLQLDPIGTRLPNSVRLSTARDSCRHMIVWGHGLIGPAFPMLVAQPEFGSYRAIATVPQVVYDLDIFVDTLSPHYHDIVNTLVPRIGNDPDYKPPVMCVW